MKRSFYSLLTIFALFSVACLSSCKDDEPANPQPTPQRDYDLNPKLIESGLHKRGLEGKIPAQYEEILDLQFYQYVFEYTSVGPDMKTPVRLTGVLSMNPAVYNREVAPKDLVLYNEYTTSKKGERTSQNELDDISMYVNKLHNCIAISADLYGWTLTEDKPQAYCCTEITAQETVDCWDAAMQILKELDFNVEGLPLYNVGYSSGALGAMAVQRYVDQKRPDIEFKATMVGGGPLDLEAIYKDYIETDTTGYVCSLPLMLVAYKETYNLPFSYNELFQEPLASHINDWILSKKYSTQGTPEDPGLNILIGPEKHVSEILTPEACDTTSAIAQAVLKKFRENSVCGPYQNWQPSKKTKFFVYHSIGDLYITHKVSVEMADYLESKGCDVVRMIEDDGNHVFNGLFYFIAESQLIMAGQKLEIPKDIEFPY